MTNLTERKRLTFTKEQAQSLTDIADAYKLGPGEFILTGLAGTGKTTVAAAIQDALDLDDDEVAYAAPTGKASNVLRYKLQDAGNHWARPTTIHKLIYSPVTRHVRKCPAEVIEDATCKPKSGCRTEWIMKPPVQRYRLIVVDESSMVNAQMRADLLAMNSQALVVFVGDHGQLPPVSGGPSPVIDPGADFTLSQIHRQVKGSPILRAAMLRRRGEPLPWGKIRRLRGYVGGDSAMHVTQKQAAEILSSASTYGDDDTLVITHTNAVRVKYNAIARRALGFKSDKPEPGDRVICRANNHKEGIYNGQIGRVVSVRPESTSTWHMQVELVHDGGRIYEGSVLKSMFGAQSQKPDKPRGVDLWDWAYVLTVHASQGSEADYVMYLRTPRPRGMTEDEHTRLDYTAITRAKSQLLIVEMR